MLGVATTSPRPSLVKGARGARSTIALKMLMAVSGLVFIGFVLGHMYGNLKAFSGHEAFNEYAEHLRTSASRCCPYERPALDHARRARSSRWSCTSPAPPRCGAGPAAPAPAGTW